ncbi:MAG: hypothetical protein CMJ13_01750 [Pelagibacterales bacterium]|nr:hypothetical protein [Pelagibacterales bacterium]|tara:strand:+ start:604 stop:1008 length:405 start_codon:yes stop_codon:yes gene_type:complete
MSIDKMKSDTDILMILFTSDFYKYYYALNLASTYQACNKCVTVFFSGYACNFLKKNWIEYDKLKINYKMDEFRMTSYTEVLKLCDSLNVKFFFCDTAVKFLNIKKIDFMESMNIKPMPLYRIVNKHKNNKTFFI